jgi:CBS-domain-containing membrane protein
VSLTIVVQEITGSQHPPGAATALIFAIVVPVQKQEFMYILTPAFLGAVLMVATAVLMNNLSPARQYPQWWLGYKPQQDETYVEMNALGQPTAADEEAAATESEEEEPSMVCVYFQKFIGAGAEAAPKPVLLETFFSFAGAFVGMSALGLIHTYFLVPKMHLPVEVAAFGAMSVLVFSLAKAPLSQPTNVVIGNTIGGAVGWAVVGVMEKIGGGHLVWLSGALSVALTIAVQERCNVVHPPGGATAMLFAVTPPLQKLGAKYIFAPAFLGSVILLVVGLVMNNLSPNRTYPQRWTFDDAKLVELCCSEPKALEEEDSKLVEAGVELPTITA